MSVIVADCYGASDQKIFLKGIGSFEEACEKKYLDLSVSQKEALVIEINNEHNRYMSGRQPGEPVHYFRMFKELTLAGYFTSEAGATKFLKYNPAPGRYDGCTTEKPWF